MELGCSFGMPRRQMRRCRSSEEASIAIHSNDGQLDHVHTPGQSLATHSQKSYRLSMPCRLNSCR
jgi:hypothetical protein